MAIDAVGPKGLVNHLMKSSASRFIFLFHLMKCFIWQDKYWECLKYLKPHHFDFILNNLRHIYEVGNLHMNYSRSMCNFHFHNVSEKFTIRLSQRHRFANSRLGTESVRQEFMAFILFYAAIETYRHPCHSAEEM